MLVIHNVYYYEVIEMEELPYQKGRTRYLFLLFIEKAHNQNEISWCLLKYKCITRACSLIHILDSWFVALYKYLLFYWRVKIQMRKT